MKKAKTDKEIKENIKWFKKFSLEKRFKLAFDQIRSIQILRGLTPKKNAATDCCC